MSGRRSMVSVRICAPNLRAKVAGTASLKKNQMCPPLPDRDRSTAAGNFIQRINAPDEITAMVVMTLQMPANHIVSYGKKTLTGTFGTFDPWLLADARDPFITTHR